MVKAKLNVEVLELTLYDDAHLVMGARDSKGEAREPQIVPLCTLNCLRGS